MIHTLPFSAVILKIRKYFILYRKCFRVSDASRQGAAGSGRELPALLIANSYGPEPCGHSPAAIDEWVMIDDIV